MTDFWTDEDKAIAAAMKRAKIPNKQIAERLGRTEKSIACLMSRIGAKRRLDGHTGGLRGIKLYSHISSADQDDLS